MSNEEDESTIVEKLVTAAANAAPVVVGAVAGTAVARRRKRKRARSGREIERKWLLAAPPPLDDMQSVEIRQGYVISGKTTEMRVRRADASFFMTVKTDAGESRNEWESEIPEWVFDAVWPLTKRRRLRKRRYTWKEGSQQFELDVYRGKLDGLIVLECEFRSMTAARKFVLPEWATGAHEVTDDPHFRNESLAIRGTKDIRRYFEIRQA